MGKGCKTYWVMGYYRYKKACHLWLYWEFLFRDEGLVFKLVILYHSTFCITFALLIISQNKSYANKTLFELNIIKLMITVLYESCFVFQEKWAMNCLQKPLPPLRTVVLRELWITVFGCWRALICIKNIFCLSNVRNLICKVIYRWMPCLTNFMT